MKAGKRRPTVVIGLLGTVLDGGKEAKRWERWRPSIGLCQQEDFLVDRFELLHGARFLRLAHAIRSDLKSVAPETKVELREIEFEDAWDFEEVYGALADFARGYPFDLDREDYYVHITTGTHVAQICLFLLAEAREFPARLIQTSPDRSGPAGKLSIIDLDLSRYDRLAARFARRTEDALATLKQGIPTRNVAFNRLIAELEHVAARTRDPILLTGPTGAGKSRLAEQIHELRRARHLVNGAFVPVNCATLRGDAALSALFGHRKGAFTGAAAERQGLLRAADGGTLFLDEIAELGPDEQAMLLRAIEERRFLPLGADQEVSSEFQLLAGTHQDLAERVRTGRFREDLLARIDTWTFCLPGLAERREDIAPNLDFELERYARERQAKVRFSAEARARYLDFARSKDATWPSNFRELSASVNRLATLAPGGRITEDIVEAEILRLRARWTVGPKAPLSPRHAEGRIHPDQHSESAAWLQRAGLGAQVQTIDLFDRVQLATVLQVCAECTTLSEAGRLLFAASRQAKGSVNDAARLRKYLARFGLDFAGVRAALAARA